MKVGLQSQKITQKMPFYNLRPQLGSHIVAAGSKIILNMKFPGYFFGESGPKEWSQVVKRPFLSYFSGDSSAIMSL